MMMGFSWRIDFLYWVFLDEGLFISWIDRYDDRYDRCKLLLVINLPLDDRTILYCLWQQVRLFRAFGHCCLLAESDSCSVPTLCQ